MQRIRVGDAPGSVPTSGFSSIFQIRACMNRCMKAITPDEEAYQRLKGWKRQGADLFSAVVKRVVPRAGSLDAMVRFAVKRSDISIERDEELESAIEADLPLVTRNQRHFGVIDELTLHVLIQ